MKMYFDIGANKGDYTESLLNSGADMVICVEPNISQVINLKRRFSPQNVIIINKAVSNVITPAIPFYICPECDVVSTCDEQWRTDSRFSQPDRTWLMQMVDVTTIDELVGLFGIPIHIKLDVEGYANVTTLYDGVTILRYETINNVTYPVIDNCKLRR